MRDIEITDIQAFINPNVPEEERDYFERAMKEILKGDSDNGGHDQHNQRTQD